MSHFKSKIFNQTIDFIGHSLLKQLYLVWISQFSENIVHTIRNLYDRFGDTLKNREYSIH